MAKLKHNKGRAKRNRGSWTTDERRARRYVVCEISNLDGVTMNPLRTYFKKQAQQAYDHAERLRDATKSWRYVVCPPVK